MARWAPALTVLVLLAGCSSVPKTFSPAEPIASKDFSHRLFKEVLRAHVSDGVVNYPAIVKDSRFDKYLWYLDRVDPNALPTREDQLAFWINAYNAFAIKGILDGYSPLTKFGQYRYFIARDYGVGGQRINLYDLERKVLIPDFREPRIHFAIVCWSILTSGSRWPGSCNSWSTVSAWRTIAPERRPRWRPTRACEAFFPGRPGRRRSTRLCFGVPSRGSRRVTWGNAPSCLRWGAIVRF